MIPVVAALSGAEAAMILASAAFSGILWILAAKEAAQFWRAGLPRATAIVLLL